MGIPAENMKTTGFYMSPNYDMKGQKVTSYTVSNNLEVKLTDLTMVSQVINKAAVSVPTRSTTSVSPMNTPTRSKKT